jgi:hypothetical protein
MRLRRGYGTSSPALLHRGRGGTEFWARREAPARLATALEPADSGFRGGIKGQSRGLSVRDVGPQANHGGLVVAIRYVERNQFSPYKLACAAGRACGHGYYAQRVTVLSDGLRRRGDAVN